MITDIKNNKRKLEPLIDYKSKWGITPVKEINQMSPK
jgi:hypothetical protein